MVYLATRHMIDKKYRGMLFNGKIAESFGVINNSVFLCAFSPNSLFFIASVKNSVVFAWLV